MNSEPEVQSINEPVIDRQAIADQVIVSAGNILVAAGFGREEIGFFFRQAADHLAPASPGLEPAPSSEMSGLARISAVFERSKPVAQLQQLIAQAAALLPLDRESADLKQCFDLAMQMAPLLAETQKGLRAIAVEAGLPMFATRDECLADANDPETAGGPPAVCLEDFENVYRGAFETIGAVADELVAREDPEAFTFMLGHLAENGVVIDRALHALIEQGLQQLRA
ncbi:MAG: hypothetical protein JWQ16_3389 [Novosphingobium sp.]|nr:hypothetical protein [Novosphingobium sp.]